MAEPPRTKKSREMMDKCASIMVDMELGTYEYPDGSRSVTNAGTPRVNKTVALREAGYKECYIKEAYTSVLKHPYYIQQCALLKQQRDGGVITALIHSEDARGLVTKISQGSLQLLANRLEDPEKAEQIKTRDLVTIAKEFFVLDQQVKGKLESGRTDKLAIVMMAANERLPAANRDKVKATLQAFYTTRGSEMENFALVGDALDENVIDGECIEDE
jgi:hypothetical protein